MDSKNNTGDDNSGDRNSGNYNSGNRNSGDRNSGDWNSGDRNSGDWNSGNFNSGNRNSGSYNSGSYNSGFFNTDEPTVRLFNKNTNIKRIDLKIPYIDLKLTEWDSETNSLITRTYKEAWGLAWKEMSEEYKDKFLNLPNFNADIFEEITGINTGKKDKSQEIGEIIEVNGKKYKLIKE